MRFSQYMDEWLYGADGYYTKYATIGKEGDFYTSVSASKFFGGSIAQHIVRQIDEGFIAKDATICEIGAHHGYLLADVIEFINTLRPELLSTLEFAIVERQLALQIHQRKYFDECFGDVIALKHFQSLDELRRDNIFFFANEIFDAFACELLYEGKIATVSEHNIEFNALDESIVQKATKYKKLKGEIAVGYEEFAQQMFKCAPKIEFVSFDYGEMLARPDFSIRVYKKHEVTPLFDENIKLAEYFQISDITYDVTFEHVKDAFEEAGFSLKDFKSQMSALIEFGIIELLEVVKLKAGDKLYQQELQKAKPLIMPDALGERFKMIRFRAGE